MQEQAEYRWQRPCHGENIQWGAEIDEARASRLLETQAMPTC